MEFVNDCFMESRTIPAADRFCPASDQLPQAAEDLRPVGQRAEPDPYA
jgi:hypothetical protein